MTKIAKEVSDKEVNSWLDFKKVGTRKREDYQEQIEIISEAIGDGYLTLDPKTFEFTQTLKSPIEGEASVTSLKFKARLKMENIRVQLASVKTGDTMGMTFAYMAALTGQPKGILKELYTDDYSIASAIMVFFL